MHREGICEVGERWQWQGDGIRWLLLSMIEALEKDNEDNHD